MSSEIQAMFSMNTGAHRARNHARSLGLALVLCGGVAGCQMTDETLPSRAESLPLQTKAAVSIASSQQTFVAGEGTARFDWGAKPVLAQEDSDQTTEIAFGQGSYICSPAGFGRKSYCSVRPQLP